MVKLKEQEASFAPHKATAEEDDDNLEPTSSPVGAHSSVNQYCYEPLCAGCSVQSYYQLPGPRATTGTGHSHHHLPGHAVTHHNPLVHSMALDTTVQKSLVCIQSVGIAIQDYNI